MAKKKKISPNYLDSVPTCSAERPWHINDEGMVEIDMENKGFYHFLAQKFFNKPRISHIALDKYGSVVWQSINGKNTIRDIIEIMKKEFPTEKDRMLDRIVTYMATLQRNGFITVKGAKK